MKEAILFEYAYDTARLVAFSSRVGTGWEIKALEAAVVGGISLRGGRGTVVGIFLGAFGNYIRRDQAKRIGLLPDAPKEKIRFIGNAAGEGSKMVLLARDLRKEAYEISKKVEYLELSARKDFQDEFMDTRFFPRA